MNTEFKIHLNTRSIMFRLFFALSLILVSVTGHRYDDVSFVRRSQGALEFRTRAFYAFKGISNFSPLKSDEKREVFHYEYTIAVRDSGKNDNKVRTCDVFKFNNKEEAKEVLSTLKKLLNVNPQEVLMDKMMDLLKDCDSVDGNIQQEPESEPAPGAETELLPHGRISLFHGIAPGTKWCGFGDIAENYHNLGRHRNVDRCCRSHDLCPISIPAKREGYNLKNNAIFTQSHCRCDEAFYDCLKKNNGWTAKLLGELYFNVAKPQCITGVPENPKEPMKFVPVNKKW